ncbi:unnamed protein product [Darwinula stevensoni]|uniref:EGF domain-specific O-linked N-acetylglucosamine transferase n=1 Tax=Darwinula stevensoni TaxID=69355 RepID=A0A7R8XEZ5_9CRUS|nr:unnamed protein product [Darwinula stevensoni]CAG0894975.1 unnamed protein product [Darwinula stevensoni]
MEDSTTRCQRALSPKRLCVNVFTMNAINSKLFPIHFDRPTTDAAEIATKFYRLAQVRFGMYTVCGCVDGTLIKLDARKTNEAQVVDRADNRSINCMVIFREKPCACWGYEDGCESCTNYSMFSCPHDSGGWTKSKKEQIQLFFEQGDFGYVREKRSTLKELCSSTSKEGASLECSEYMTFCRGKKIWLDVRHLVNRTDNLRYKMDVLNPGNIGGYCRWDTSKENHLDHKSPLQSWSPELQNFIPLSQDPFSSGECDVMFEKPVIIMKLDAQVSMYHHFCDFFNLYASLHVNNSHPNTFTTDVHIILWESYPYRSSFAPAWKAFTKYPVKTIKDYEGNRLCFHNIMLPLLPRMIFGLYYNTPLVYGCQRSGLFHAFNRFMLHRLGVPLRKHFDPSNIHVVLLSRKTKHRNIINEDELLDALKLEEGITVTRVEYSWHTDFLWQVKTTHTADVFIGIHGSGLTHLLFLPDWAVIFELYNCEDEGCYKDLARLRGVEYITWEDPSKVFPNDKDRHPEVAAHAKFTNYAFEVKEFLRLVHKAIAMVKASANHDKPMHNEL